MKESQVDSQLPIWRIARYSALEHQNQQQEHQKKSREQFHV